MEKQKKMLVQWLLSVIEKYFEKSFLCAYRLVLKDLFQLKFKFNLSFFFELLSFKKIDANLYYNLISIINKLGS